MSFGRKWLEHAAGLAEAERFAGEQQQAALAAALPEDLRQRVTVAPTVHTDEATFMYNQPTLTPLPGAIRW